MFKTLITDYALNWNFTILVLFIQIALVTSYTINTAKVLVITYLINYSDLTESSELFTSLVAIFEKCVLLFREPLWLIGRCSL